MDRLKTVLIPLDITLGDKRHNLAAIEDRVNEVDDDTDLVILPEMCNTGFGDIQDSLPSLAESTSGETISRMKVLSEKKGVAIIGGFIRKDGDDFYNSAFVVSNGELLAVYDKRHLFAGPEQKLFRRGQSFSPIVTIKGWRIRIAICYDLRFPVWNRSRGLNYDAIVFIANWVHVRNYAWRHLLIARAIENQAYVLACNREGRDFYGEYMRGDSMIINAMGYPIGTQAENGNISTILDRSQLESDRRRLKPWKDADDFTIDI